MIADIWQLSMTSSMNGAVADYQVIKDASKRYKLDSLEVLRVIKGMNGVFGEK